MFILSGKEEVISFKGFEFKYVLKNRMYDTNHLIVVFSGFGAKSNFTYDFLNALSTSRAYVLWIKDDFYDNDKSTYYIDPVHFKSNKLEQAIISFLDSVLSFLEINRKDCTFLGASKGGASALFYGIKYNISNILVSAPTILIGSSVAGITPKGAIKNNAKFLVGDSLNNECIKQLDSIILSEIEGDVNYDRNIYLISSKADNRYLGQIKPFLGYFHKYYNFNFIESQSVLVRTHQEVTSHNTPLILSILGCLTFNLPASFKNSVIHGDKLDKVANITKEPILKVDRMDFDSNGMLYPEGVFFLRGIPCADYHDLKYILKLKSDDNIYKINLAKDYNKHITKKYYKDAFVNYDKAYFCTTKHKGLNMSNIKPGIYQLYIEIKMRTGEACEIPLFVGRNVKSKFSNTEFIQSVYSYEHKVFYSKLNAKKSIFRVE